MNCWSSPRWAALLSKRQYQMIFGMSLDGLTAWTGSSASCIWILREGVGFVIPCVGSTLTDAASYEDSRAGQRQENCSPDQLDFMIWVLLTDVVIISRKISRKSGDRHERLEKITTWTTEFSRLFILA
jgi:hypothetical protein